MKTRFLKTKLILICALTQAACSHDSERISRSTEYSSETERVSAAQKAAPQPALTDAQIAAIVVASNDVDIDTAKVAKRSKNDAVQAFARQMIDGHQNVNKEAKTLVKKMDIKPEETDASRGLKDGGKAYVRQLRDLKGEEFDRSYVEREITFHKQVLDTIDSQLLPSAQNEELKAMLQRVRPYIDAHLKHAESLKASLNKSM